MGDTFFLLPGAPPELPRTFQAAWAELHGVTVDRNRLRHVERVALGPHVLYVKFFHRPRWADLARNFFSAPQSRSQAEREVRMAGALFACGLKAVTPVAYGQRRLGPLERASVLITREQPGPTLGESLRTGSGAAKAWSARLLALICALFRHDLFLPDLSLEHILVAEDQDLVLLDLHNAGRKPPYPGPRCAHPGTALGRRAGHLLPACRARPGCAGAGALFQPLPAPRRAGPGRPARSALGKPGAPQTTRAGPAMSSQPRPKPRVYDAQAAQAYARRSPLRNAREGTLLRRALASLPEGLSALDTPCGTGRLRPLLGELGFRYVGCDLSREMLLLAGEGLQADTARLPFREHSFDLVVSFRFLHHFAPETQETFLRELARVTADTLVVSFFHPWSVHALSRRLRCLLRGRPSGRHVSSPTRLCSLLALEGFGPGRFFAETRFPPRTLDRDLFAPHPEGLNSPPPYKQGCPRQRSPRTPFALRTPGAMLRPASARWPAPAGSSVAR